MRNDMDKLIVKGRSSPKDRSNHEYKVRDVEDLPERGKMKDPSYGWYSGPRDHLNPLLNFLKSRVGKPWAKVYAEICDVTDHRSFEGRHLREHIDQMVISEEKLAVTLGRRYGRHYWEFYYDHKGVLREWKGEGWIGAYRRPEPNPDKCVVNGRPYLRVNGCWFEGEYFTVPTEALEWQDVPGERKRQLLPKQYTRSKKQLNKKELKALNLSNEPGWKWYE